MSIIELNWKGPYKFIGNERSVFNANEADEPGIYLWAVEYKDGYLVYYTGETGRSFKIRLAEHIKEYLSGYYRVYDADKFKTGEKEIVWGGTWMESAENNLSLFLEDYKYYSNKIYDFLNVLEIFIAPLNFDKRKRNRIESAIANCFYVCEGIVGNFQEKEIKYAKRVADETIIEVNNKSGVKILGLKEHMQI